MGKMEKREEKNVRELTQKIEELEENWKRALADYHNVEKRVKEEKGVFVRLATAAIIDKFLGVLDDLDRASSHLNDKGLGLVLARFRQVLDSEDVKEIPVEGKEFDPQTMECVEMVAGQKNKVASVVQRGYTLHDLVIRPTKVKVGMGIEHEVHKDESKKGEMPQT